MVVTTLVLVFLIDIKINLFLIKRLDYLDSMLLLSENVVLFFRGNGVPFFPIHYLHVVPDLHPVFICVVGVVRFKVFAIVDLFDDLFDVLLDLVMPDYFVQGGRVKDVILDGNCGVSINPI